jgi:SOS-response transcriptional repressor LexA
MSLSAAVLSDADLALAGFNSSDALEPGRRLSPSRLSEKHPQAPLMVAEENLEAWVRIPADLLKPGGSSFFLLRVRGDSMNQARVQGDLIENGDLAVVRQQGEAEPGQIVVALIGGEATIKRLTKGVGFWVLKPESTNRSHQPIILTDEFRVQGVVVRILKRGTELLEEHIS